ncbi:hypothetical protein [Nocardioides sp. P86]|uniref:hypothetical protein n=1 Tax=Nocardioides sp. P86 TaxID=2939569 RepID=UPI0020425689|nr:hypothetical protein [Nocardioides sp. P86]MCM3516238.1 hypothetical protein [Nocardioides sp. P86]
MVVSVPEKTLEHWASIYLTYRYRSHAALWWPTSGEDIHVGYLPPSAGKAVQLELKTTTLKTKGDVHDVKIDLWQLDNYLAKPYHLRPFYVFPVPHWTDTLEAAATAAGLPVAELGFGRANSYTPTPWWFASWTVAMTTDDVAAILSTQLANYHAGGTSKASLVRFSFKTGTRLTKWADGKRHRTIPWQSLWTKLDECGRRNWPQIVRVPAAFVRSGASVSHADIRGLLAEARDGDEELVTLGSTGEGTFELVDEPSGYRDDLPDRDERIDHRIAVFLGAAALQLD